MKKPLFITFVVVISLLILGTAAYGGYTAYNYSQTIDDFEVLEQTKLITVNNSDSFVNPNDLSNDIKLEAEVFADYAYIYKKDNIHFLSNLDVWNESKLKMLADELYANKHGEEIKYLSLVILHEGTENYILGTQESIEETFDVPVSLYNFLPDDNFITKSILSEINLYEADKYTSVAEMAIVLSHEYGHHFTNYHFGLNFSYSDKQTDYYKLRGEGIDEVLVSTNSYGSYLANHMWYLVELAAEDYVYFMGSRNAHRVVEFYDAYDLLQTYTRYGEEAVRRKEKIYELCRNGTPHENITLGLPSDIEGLEEYFYSFIDEDVPQREEREDIGTLNLTFDRLNSRRCEITWDQPFIGNNVVYTLILYTENDQPICMPKTTKGIETGIAKLGKYSLRMLKGRNTYLYTYYWNVIPSGEKVRARVSITFPDGTIMLSDPIDFVY